MNCIDSEFLTHFQEALCFQAYDYLDGEKEYREDQKKKFLANEVRNPTLDYPKIDIEQCQNREKLLEKALQKVSDLPQLPRMIYQDKILEKIQENDLIIAAKNNDDLTVLEKSLSVYGSIDRELFEHFMHKTMTKAKALLKSNSDAEKKAGENYLKLLSHMPTVSSTIELPEAHVVLWFKEYVLQQMEPLLGTTQGMDHDSMVNAETIATVFSTALNLLHADDWTINLCTNSRTGISVSQERKTVDIPTTREVSVAKLRALVCHEIGTHVQRRICGTNSPLQLFGLGFAGYEEGEEGVTTAMEQALDGTVKDYKGFDGTFAIGLALGLDGFTRDFRDTFSILQAYYAMEKSKKMSYEEAMIEATTSAFNRCIRTFRGTTCSTKGACFTKDKIYATGNYEIWQWLTTMYQQGDSLPDIFAGKYNPANPKHLAAARELGLI